MERDPVRELYSKPLAEFTAARNALANELKANGDTELAERVKKLQKPTSAAWALNQVAIHDASLIDELVSATESVEKSSDRAGFRAASDARRAAIAAIVEAASDRLVDSGGSVTATTREQMTQTLLAVGSDEDALASLRAGTIAKEAEPGGFAGFGGSFEAAEEEDDEAGSELREAKDAAAELAEEAKRLKTEAREARAKAEELRRDADRADRAADKAQQKAEDAKAEADRAAARVKELRK